MMLTGLFGRLPDIAPDPFAVSISSLIEAFMWKHSNSEAAVLLTSAIGAKSEFFDGNRNPADYTLGMGGILTAAPNATCTYDAAGHLTATTETVPPQDFGIIVSKPVPVGGGTSCCRTGRGARTAASSQYPKYVTTIPNTSPIGAQPLPNSPMSAFYPKEVKHPINKIPKVGVDRPPESQGVFPNQTGTGRYPPAVNYENPNIDQNGEVIPRNMPR
jgi:hypothetical protein